MMVGGWRRLAEWAIARSGAPAVGRRITAPSAAVLAYHNVVPDGERPVGDLGLHVDQRAFASHLDLLVESHDVVPLEALGAVPSTSDGRSRVAITFDDAYSGALTAGLGELVRRGLPATVFVAPGMLGGEGCWWDVLAAEPGESLGKGIREHALHVLQGKQSAIMDWAVREGLRRVDPPPHARPASHEELLACASAPGVSLGAHTWSHPNLSALPRHECAAELRRSRDWVVQQAPQRSGWLAYPYGLRNGTTVEEARAVFDGALLVEGGHAVVRGRARGAACETPRINVPRGLTLDGLRLRLAGIVRA